MKYILLAISLIITACATEPDHNFYSYYHGYQVVVGSADNKKPIGWEPAGSAVWQPYNPFAFSNSHK